MGSDGVVVGGRSGVGDVVRGWGVGYRGVGGGRSTL